MKFFVIVEWNGVRHCFKTDEPPRTKQRPDMLEREVGRYLLTETEARYSLNELTSLAAAGKLKFYEVQIASATPECFRQLGLEGIAKVTRELIEQAYRTLAKDCHPDAGGNHNLMVRLNNARDRALKLVTA